MEGVPASKNYKGGFSCNHMLKDLELAAANQGDLPLPMGRKVLEMYTKVRQPFLCLSVDWALCSECGKASVTEGCFLPCTLTRNEIVSPDG